MAKVEGGCKMKNVLKVGAIAVVALTLGACQTNQVMGSLGALGGGAAGGYAANKFIGKGQGKLLATAGGALGGAVLGGLFGNSLGLPYTNSGRIDQNQSVVAANGQRMDGLERRVDSRGNVVYVQPQVQSQAPAQRNPYNCAIRNNYVICND